MKKSMKPMLFQVEALVKPIVEIRMGSCYEV